LLALASFARARVCSRTLLLLALAARALAAAAEKVHLGLLFSPALCPFYKHVFMLAALPFCCCRALAALPFCC
jgi:hypothetical protein